MEPDGATVSRTTASRATSPAGGQGGGSVADVHVIHDTVDVEVLHRVGRALSDPSRCRIMLCLADRPHYPTELAEHLGLSRANTSNHLSCLRGCGLVVAVQEGRRQRYELVDPALAHALHDLMALRSALSDAHCNLQGAAQPPATNAAASGRAGSGAGS